MRRRRCPPREGLREFFSGRDAHPDEGDMIDRTFCALRVWAATKPAEVEQWIVALEDKGMLLIPPFGEIGSLIARGGKAPGYPNLTLPASRRGSPPKAAPAMRWVT